MQPSGEDMTDMAKITAWKDAGDVVVVEGEAAGAYPEYTDKKPRESRPALDRFRRTFIWVKEGYLLVLDDIRSPVPVQITWLVQGAKLDPVDAACGLYHLSKNKAECDFQLLADSPFQSKIGVSTANDHGKLLNWQQLQAGVHAAKVRFAAAFDPWHKKGLTVALKPDGADQATITITGPGINDTWQWQAAGGKFEAATCAALAPADST